MTLPKMSKKRHQQAWHDYLASRSRLGGQSFEDFVKGWTPKAKPKRVSRRPVKGAYKGIAAPGDDLGQAAKVIADEARRIAAGNGMPETADSISVTSDGKTATVYSDAPAAYPNEVKGVRHPVYGHGPWVENEYRPFLAPAADAKASDAMRRYEKHLDDMIKKAGFV